MRRHASERAMGKQPRKAEHTGCPRVSLPRRRRRSEPRRSEGRTHPAGWRTVARRKRVTQKPGRPQTLRGESRERGTGIEPRRPRLGPGRRRSEKNKTGHRGRNLLRDNWRRDPRSWGVGGPYRSCEVGERRHPDPAEQRGAEWIRNEGGKHGCCDDSRGHVTGTISCSGKSQAREGWQVSRSLPTHRCGSTPSGV